MIDEVRNFAIDWQDWASMQSLSLAEISDWQEKIKELADIADNSGDLIEELKENGIL